MGSRNWFSMIPLDNPRYRKVARRVFAPFRGIGFSTVVAVSIVLIFRPVALVQGLLVFVGRATMLGLIPGALYLARRQYPVRLEIEHDRVGLERWIPLTDAGSRDSVLGD